eukprot:scaffold306600_cov19-Tisochrysis_lutea.AAC.1
MWMVLSISSDLLMTPKIKGKDHGQGKATGQAVAETFCVKMSRGRHTENNGENALNRISDACCA